MRMMMTALAGVRKGGEVEATIGRKCLCNGLMADAGVPQLSPFKKEGEDERYLEEILVTMGDDVNAARKFMKEDESTHAPPPVRPIAPSCRIVVAAGYAGG